MKKNNTKEKKSCNFSGLEEERRPGFPSQTVYPLGKNQSCDKPFYHERGEGGQRDGLTVKLSYWLCREQNFTFQHIHILHTHNKIVLI